MRNTGDGEPMELLDGFWEDENPEEYLSNPLIEVLKRRDKWDVRWLIRTDMPEVMDIEKHQFDAWVEWSEEDYIRELKRPNSIGQVEVNSDNRLIGAIICRLHSNRYEIIHITAAPGDDQEDVFLILLAKMVSKGGPLGSTRGLLTICVDMGQHALIRAMQKANFSFPERPAGDQMKCGRLISRGLGGSQ